MRNRPITLDELIDLETLLARDEQADRQTLRHRDRALGLELAHSAGNRRELFLGWLARMRQREPDLPGETAVRALNAVSVLSVALGLLFGSAAAVTVFAYTGDHPVNVIHVLGVFVFIPIVLLAVLLVAVLPGTWLQAIPGAGAVHDLAGLLSPARLIPLLSNVLPREMRQAFQQSMARLKGFDRLYGRIRLWLLITLSQRFAVAFFVAAIAQALLLIVFTDLAFGWGTTLQVDASLFYRIVRALAAPWGWAWPQAVPTRELVETTQYYRQGGVFAGLGAQASAPALSALGGWWPFLVACMAFYGLLPRMVMLAWAQASLKRGLADVPLKHAAFERLHERLTEPLVESQARGGGSPMPNLEGPVAIPSVPSSEKPYVLVLWEWPTSIIDAIGPMLKRRFGATIERTLSAGGLDVEADRQVLEVLEREARGSHVAIVVKSYEPPTRDFSNFMEQARRRVGDSTLFVVMPLDLAEDGQPAQPNEHDLAHWARRVGMSADPYTRVASLFGESGS